MESYIELDIYKKILTVLKKKKNFKFKSIHLHEPYFDRADSKSLEKVINSSFVSTTGPLISVFEKNIAKFTGSKYAVCMINATAALHISMILLNIKKNDEVLIPSLNYIASTNAILYCGGVPHFVDVSEEDLGIDVKKLDLYLNKIAFIKNNQCLNKITKRKIKAIIPTHVFGNPMKIDSLKNICKKYNINLIEDASEALGSFYKKQHVGTFGDMGVISFNGNKIITTGSGGVLLTNQKNIALKALKLSKVSKENHLYDYYYKDIGYNYRMNNIAAALGIQQLKKIKKLVKAKRKLFQLYKKEFHGKKMYILEENKNCYSNYWLQTLILKNCNFKLRKKIIKFLIKKKIFVRPVWRLLHKLKHLKKYPRMDLEVSENLHSKIINLPSSPGIILN